MKPLREVIKAAIESAGGDTEKAAIAVCLVLDDELDISGNGWFDGDEVIEKALSRR